MKLDASSLEALKETRRYPALLARLSQVDAEDALTELEPAQLLADVFADIGSADQEMSTFAGLLEDGEIAAARKFHELAELSKSERSRIVRRASACQQELQQTKRRVMGLLLLLKDTLDPSLNERRQRVRTLVNNEDLCDLRPGWVTRQLQGEEESLERIISHMLQEIRCETRKLEESTSGAQNRDLSLALERLEQLLQSQENLPAAQRMLKLARRAAEGTLNRDDLKNVHQSGPHRQRLVRPWVDFDALNVEDATSITRLLRAEDEAVQLPSDFDRRMAKGLFETLSLKNNRLKTANAAAKLLEFLSLDGDLNETSRSGVGSSFTLRFSSPRVPAFRSSRFSAGIQLVIPHVADTSAFAQLLKQVPEKSFPIVYFPGKLDKSMADHFHLREDVPHFDNLDLLRLCEVPHGQRELAFQQVILPRSPFSRVKPWQLGGPVSAEMFKGREKIIDKLKSPKGGTVLFSGRMMGKSSILDRIYREIENESNRPEARAIKVSNTSVDVFRSLVDNLAALLPERDAKKARREIDKLQFSPSLTPSQRSERAEQRLDLIRKLINRFLEEPDAHLSVLIDEADRFASDDARQPREHSIAWLLRDLEFDEPERFRVVFAGFQTIHDQVIAENGAFANWYGHQQLSTLEDSDAQALIVEPFADFAFIFASQAGVDRISEFTGGHPLLIQEVSSRLMERMHARRTGHLADEVITIEAGDVEVVCRDDQLRDRLHQVLSLNLNKYRRLKLMVYLILDSCGSGTEATLRLNDFSLGSLKAELIKWYGEQFNEYFDEKNIGALVSRLKALGLLQSRGDTYQFVNRTFARMLMEDPAFEQKLEGLLSFVTDPVQGQQRRFVTLPNEHLERVAYSHDQKEQNFLFIGLPGTRRQYIARKLFGQIEDEHRGSFLISGADCTTVSDVRDRLKQELGERRTTLSLADFVVKNELETLVISNADTLADTGALSAIAQSLNERDRRVVAFGGAATARAYVGRLFAENFDAIRLERLRPQDIQEWGHERLYAEEGHAIIFDDNTTRGVRRATGGYLPLISRFADFVRKNHQTAKEYLPSQEDVDKFFHSLEPSLIQQALLDSLSGPEQKVISALYKYACEESLWKFDGDWIEQLLLPAIEERTELQSVTIRDVLDILQLLDLVEFHNKETGPSLLLNDDGPLRKLLAEH